MTGAWKRDWDAKRARQEQQQPEYRKALDIHSGFRPKDVPGPHGPWSPAYGNGGVMRWQCEDPDCEYWTGYGSKTRASKQILAHADSKNRQLGLPTETRSA